MTKRNDKRADAAYQLALKAQGDARRANEAHGKAAADSAALIAALVKKNIIKPEDIEAEKPKPPTPLADPGRP